ncbi:MAG: hypothetical protein IJ971_06215 [Bacteroidales bacterium]|nr:hypothetical protein [Bacteroidales bacterium]
MARKTTISDFCALKGKVTFSEKISDAKVLPKVTPAATQEPKVSDEGLKIGQSIVLMDLLPLTCISKRFLEAATSLRVSNSSSRWKLSERLSERTCHTEE